MTVSYARKKTSRWSKKWIVAASIIAAIFAIWLYCGIAYDGKIFNNSHLHCYVGDGVIEIKTPQPPAPKGADWLYSSENPTDTVIPFVLDRIKVQAVVRDSGKIIMRHSIYKIYPGLIATAAVISTIFCCALWKRKT